MKKPEGFRYDFTYKELVFFLFGKDKCPRCGTKMDRFKDFELVNGGQFNTRQSAFFRPNSLIKHYCYRYKCPACGLSKTLSELVK